MNTDFPIEGSPKGYEGHRYRYRYRYRINKLKYHK